MKVLKREERERDFCNANVKLALTLLRGKFLLILLDKTWVGGQVPINIKILC